jgi:hypothetical protein
MNMKKLLIFLIALMLISNICFGSDTYIWTGSNDYNWQNHGNWQTTNMDPSSWPGYHSSTYPLYTGILKIDDDYVIFNDGSVWTITGVPTCTLGKLEVTFTPPYNLSTSVFLEGTFDGSIITMKPSGSNDPVFIVDEICMIDLNTLSHRVKLVCEPGAHVLQKDWAIFNPADYPVCSAPPQGPQVDYGFLLQANATDHAEYIETENTFQPVKGWTEYYFDDSKHHYFCAPITSEFTPEFMSPNYNCRDANSLCEFDGDYVCKFDNGNNWGGWIGNCAPPTSNIETGRGYHYYGNPTNNSSGRYEFKGTFNCQTAPDEAGFIPLNPWPVPSTLGYAGASLGWNFVGNPFPSAIKFDPPGGAPTPGEGWIWDKLHTDPIVYWWDNSIGGSGGFRWYNWYNGFGSPTPDTEIPRSQGFFVHVSAYPLLNAVIWVGNKARIFRGTKQIAKSVIANHINVTLNDASGKTIDNAIIHFNDDAIGSDFDRLRDAYKLYNDINNVSQLYFKTTDNIDVAMKTLQLATGKVMYPLYMKVVNTDTYSLDVKDINTFSPNTGILLKDNKTNTTVDLKVNPVYAFTATAGDDDARFSLYFSDLLYSINDLDDNTFKVYSNDNSIYIRNNDPKSVTGTVLVYDMIGKQMMQQNLNGDAITRINPNLNRGFYIVSVKTDKGVSNQKVYIN